MSRVLLHTIVFPPDGVSTAYIMADLAVELKHLGHTVCVLTTTPHYNIDQNAVLNQPMQRYWAGLLYYSEFYGIPVWHIKLPMKGKRVWTRVGDYIRFHMLSMAVSISVLGQQDIVIATSPPITMGVISYLLGVRWKVPSVYKVAELYPDLAIHQGMIRSSWMISALRWLERFVYSHNTMIVPIAGQFRKTIQERGVPDHKLSMIPDFVDTELYRPLPRINQFAEKHGLLHDFVVLYAGNIGLVQDWDSVLYAAEKLKDFPIQFVIVGDGLRREWLFEEIKDRNLQNIKLLGYQPKSLMPQINASCDIGMIPMKRAGAQDGFPSKIYTNLASAKPVIVSAAPDSDMANFLTYAKCGRVITPENPQAFTEAILEAFRNRDVLSTEGERGRRFVKGKFSKQAITRRYDALIRELTNQ
ncbi:MAG TPA: glycosyltransferase family 4 protein [Desulfosporosinus sp.]|nr:glycosyltransferase family 4 protein [Desulfosporosinus sp.]